MKPVSVAESTAIGAACHGAALHSYAPVVEEAWFDARPRQPSGKNPNLDLTGMGAMVLNWFVELEEVFVLQMVSPLILKLSLFLVTAVATHLVMSFGQTFLHYKVAHNPIGGKLFRTSERQDDLRHNGCDGS